MLFKQLGFGFCSGDRHYAVCCYFSKADEVEKFFIISCLFLGSYVSLRILNIEPYYLKPFSDPICLIAGNGICSTASILGNAFWWSSNRRGGQSKLCLYILVNAAILMILNLLGNAYQMPGLINISLLYGGIYALEWYTYCFF